MKISYFRPDGTEISPLLAMEVSNVVDTFKFTFGKPVELADMLNAIKAHHEVARTLIDSLMVVLVIRSSSGVSLDWMREKAKIAGATKVDHTERKVITKR